MINKVTKTIAGVAIAGVAMFGLAACSNEPAPAPTATIPAENVPAETPSDSMEVMAPVTVNLTEINDTTQTLKVGQVLNLNVADEDPSVWSGVSSEPMVAIVTEGSAVDGVVMNPGVQAGEEGRSTVTFTNSFTQEVVTFEVIVSA